MGIDVNDIVSPVMKMSFVINVLSSKIVELVFISTLLWGGRYVRLGSNYVSKKLSLVKLILSHYLT